MSSKIIESIDVDSITTNGQKIPAPDVCNDPLALNDGENAPCKYSSEDSGEGCGCNKKGKNSNNRVFGMSKKTWIWIIIGAIVLYYFTRKGAKAPKVS